MALVREIDLTGFSAKAATAMNAIKPVIIATQYPIRSRVAWRQRQNCEIRLREQAEALEGLRAGGLQEESDLRHGHLTPTLTLTLTLDQGVF